jgi:hypothetical protein
VISIATVLHSRVSPGQRSPTKLIILTAHQTRPNCPPQALGELALGHQFNDLRRAQDYLFKQQGWLDFVVVAPGMIIDSESGDSGAVVQGVKLEESGEPNFTISYARLAAAMRLAASDPKWKGKFVLPVPTDKVPFGIKHMVSAFEVVKVNVLHRLIPALTPIVGLSLAAAGIGYVWGVREQGVWLAQRWGVDLKA